jgi:hypothetical protein
MFDMSGMNLPSYLGEKKAPEITDEEFANMIEAPNANTDETQA